MALEIRSSIELWKDGREYYVHRDQFGHIKRRIRVKPKSVAVKSK